MANFDLLSSTVILSTSSSFECPFNRGAFGLIYEEVRAGGVGGDGVPDADDL